MSTVFKDQDNDFDNNKLTNLDSINVDRIPTIDNELTNKKKYVDDSINENTIVRLNQTLQSKLKVTVGNNEYNLTNYDIKQIIDRTVMKYPNNGGSLSQEWNIHCNEEK